MKAKTNLRIFFDKLLFRDIAVPEDQQTGKKIRRAKRLALAAIIAVFVIGLILTAGYALSHYNQLKAAFFAEPEAIEELGAFNPGAVWFTGESGDPYLIQGIIAYLHNYEDSKLMLDVVNVNDIPVELLSVQDKDGQYVSVFPQDTVLEANEDFPLYTFTLEDIEPMMVAVRSEIYIHYRYDDGVERRTVVNPFMKENEAVFMGTEIRTTDNTQDFANLIVEKGQVYFEGEQIRLNQPLFIPSGKTFLVSAGQEIDLTNQAFILSRSPVIFEGTASDPIRLYTSDGTGRGLLVMQAADLSTVRHAIFDGLDTTKSGIWELTGAVTFYESDVEITDSQFTNNSSEDALNIIRSTFSISSSYFANTASDAFDADFCEGTIRTSLFENTTNDAIDVSGSLVRIEDTQTVNNGDKGISVGEQSTVDLENISIDRAVVGIASKDLSVITGKDIAISNTRIALTLYIKKAEFGPAEIRMDDVSLSGDIDIEYLIQPSSTLTVDGQLIRPRFAAKETLLFEKMISGEPIQ